MNSKFKKIMGICLSMTLVFSLTLPVYAESYDESDSLDEELSKLQMEVNDEENPNYKSIDGVLFSKDETKLIRYPAGKKETNYTIPDSVTSIGKWAFDGCTGLTSIIIPNSVTSIGQQAFKGCTGLTSITIPDSVTSIGKEAFEGCTGLTSFNVDKKNPNYKSINGVLFSKDGEKLIRYPAGKKETNYTIPDSVKEIGALAFSGCEGLTSITIPNSVTEIWGNAFYLCEGLTSFNVDERNQCFKSIDGVLFSKDEKTLIQYPIGRNATNYIIPNSVTSIGDSAFVFCVDLTSINIPNSVTEIGSRAFLGCTGLTSITIPNSVTSIGWRAFVFCTGLTEVTIPNSVTEIGKYAFACCKGLTSVTIGNGVKEIGNGTFSGCTGLTSVAIPNSVTEIWDNAFCGCKGLTEVTIPNSVTSIGQQAFSGCIGLTEVTIPNSVTEIGRNAFEGYVQLHIQKEPDTTDAFNGNQNLQPTLPTLVPTLPCDEDIIKSIKEWQLENGAAPYVGRPIDEHNTSAPTFPNQTQVEDSTGVNKNTVKDSNSLAKESTDDTKTSVTTESYKFPSPYLYNTGRSRFNNEDIEILMKTIRGEDILPDGLKKIGKKEFKGRTYLTSVTIPNSVTSIDCQAFYHCERLTSINVDEGNPNYKSIDGVLFSKDGTELIRYPIGKKETNYIIPDSVTKIGRHAFSGCTGLKEVTVPKSAKIADNAFDRCNAKINRI